MYTFGRKLKCLALCCFFFAILAPNTDFITLITDIGMSSEKLLTSGDSNRPTLKQLPSWPPLPKVH